MSNGAELESGRKNCKFQQTSRRISETVQHRTKVTVTD